MKAATTAVKSKSISIRQAAKEFNVLKSTYDRRVDKKPKSVKHFGWHIHCFEY